MDAEDELNPLGPGGLDPMEAAARAPGVDDDYIDEEAWLNK